MSAPPIMSAPTSRSTVHRRLWLLAAALIAATVLVGCLPVLLGRAAPLWDASVYFGPMFTLVADHARAGRLALWDPWISSGSPIFAEPQLGAASPVLLLFGLLWPNPFHGFVAYWLTLWIFGGVGMMLFARHLNAPIWGACAIALGFAACGVYTGDAEHTSVICSLSYLPWVLWQFDRGATSGRTRPAILAGLLWGLSALGGYPGLTIMTPIVLALWGVGRSTRAADLARALVLVALIGGAVMSPSYVSFLYENQGYTDRADPLDRAYALGSNALPPAAFATLASPALSLLRTPENGPIWPETDLSMTSLYMGSLVVIFALAAFGRPSRWRLWLGGLVVFFAACAVGGHLPVRGWIYDLVPPTRYFRHPAMLRAYVIVLTSALAAAATGDLETMRRTRGRPVAGGFPLAMAALAGAAAAIAFVATMHGVHQSVFRFNLVEAHVIATWLLAAMLFLALWQVAPSRRFWDAAVVALACWDASATLRIAQSTLYESVSLPWWQAMGDGHVAAVDRVPGGLERQVLPPDTVGAVRSDRNVPLRSAVFASSDALKNAFYLRDRDDASLYGIAVGPNRSWFSDRPVWLNPTATAFTAFEDAVHRRGSQMLVLSRPGDLTAAPPEESNAATQEELDSAPALSNANVDLVRYEPDALVFRYHANRDGWLLVTDRWSRSWTVDVNGRPQPIQIGNFVFRAVPVTRGDNLIAFRYRPSWYFVLVALSWTTIAATGWSLRPWRRGAGVGGASPRAVASVVT